MKENKTKKTGAFITTVVALVIIGALIIVTLVVGGFIIVRNVNRANNLETVPIRYTISAQDVTETETETDKENTEATVATSESSQQATQGTSSQTQNATQGSTSKATKSTKATQPTTNKNQQATQGTTSKKEPIEQIIPNTEPLDKNEKVLKINGVKCNVGNTITVTLDVKTPKVLENFQGYTTYDSEYLEFKGVTCNVNGLANNNKGAIYYNGSDISKGFDFTQKGTLYVATFKVKKAGTTTIKNTIQVMSDQKSAPVNVNDCNISIGIYN